MRDKESHADYRFIKDPDLPSLKLKKAEVDLIRKELPESPLLKMERIIKEYDINSEDARVLISSLDIVEFFEKILEDKSLKPSFALPWITTELLGVCNYNKKSLKDMKIRPEHFISLLKLVDSKKITDLKAKDILRSWKNGSSVIKEEDKGIIVDKKELEKVIESVLKDKNNNKALKDYLGGQEQAINFLIGSIMKATNKSADYNTARKALIERLKKTDK